MPLHTSGEAARASQAEKPPSPWQASKPKQVAIALVFLQERFSPTFTGLHAHESVGGRHWWAMPPSPDTPRHS